MHSNAWINLPFSLRLRPRMMRINMALCIAMLGLRVWTATSEDIPTSAIDTNSLLTALPQDWTVVSVEAASSPEGWRTMGGDRGVRVRFANTNLVINHFMGFSYNPSYSFTMMPTNWSGSNRLQQAFASGEVAMPTNPLMAALQEYPDRYAGLVSGWYVFESYLGHDSWDHPFELLEPVLRRNTRSPGPTP